MEGKRFIHKIKLQNFLSYGSEGEEIELQPLNVLIGANASGKSNLIEALEILRATPKPQDFSFAFRHLGGVSDFIWKGQREDNVAVLQTWVKHELTDPPLSYQLAFTESNQRFLLVKETIEDEYPDPDTNEIFVYYKNFGKINQIISNYKVKEDSEHEKIEKEIWDRDMVLPNQSILSQLQDIRKYPEITYLGRKFSEICIYKDLPIGRNCKPRQPQPVDLPIHPLLEDGSNLGLVLNNLQHEIGSRKIIDYLKKFYEAAEELSIRFLGGTVQIFIREQGMSQPIPATRLSDGTLRYLFLMALLLDPTPPPLICLEEPEIGLHPDILSTVAEMLVEASQRTQLIVTTHSDALISALSEYPECVLVCERDSEGSHLRRLEPDKLKDWLENYTLGDLWLMGEIGGNRW